MFVSSFTYLFAAGAAQRLVSAAAAGQARHLPLPKPLLARGAYPQRRSRCPLQTMYATCSPETALVQAGDGRRKSLDFRNCKSMQVNDTAKGGRYRKNPCLPGERETAPSLGVRLVNAGRKREEKPGRSNRTTRKAGKATMDNTSQGALRCRHAEPANPSQGKKPDDRLAQNGKGLKVYQAHR